MNTIIGDTLLYALGDAVKKQEEIINIISKNTYESEAKKMSVEQLKLLRSLHRLCERIF